MRPRPAQPLIAALDEGPLARARRRAREVGSSCGAVKVGLHLFLSEGPRVVRALTGDGHAVFLDLKLHDIPKTVHRATASAVALRPRLVNVHALGGPEMVSAAAEACAKAHGRTRLLAVTILTSQDGRALHRLGIRGTVPQAVLRLARLALRAGADGLVCSPLEVTALRRAFGRGPILVTPGVRGAGERRGDQRRVAGAGEAVAAGADYVVVGRPLWEASSPRSAAAALAAECAAALR